MKFNLFLLFLIIFAADALANPVEDLEERATLEERAPYCK